MTHVDVLEELELVGLNREDLADFSGLVNFSTAELVEFSGLVDFRRAEPEQASTVQLVMVHDADGLKELAAFSSAELVAFSQQDLADFSREELVTFSQQDLANFSRSELEGFSSAELEEFISPGLTDVAAALLVGWIKSVPVRMMSLLMVSDIRWKHRAVHPKRAKLNVSLPQVKLPQVKLFQELPQAKLPQVKRPQVKLPRVRLPQELPQVKRPRVKLPRELPQGELLEAKRSRAKLPQLKRPQLGLPLLGLPLIVIAALVAPTIWLAKSPEGYTQSEQQVLPVETTVLEGESSYKVSRAYTGELVARRSSDLGFELTGMVIALLVEEGDTVAAGAPLARLDTRDLSAQRLQLEAQKRQLQAQLQELEVGPRQEDIRSAEAAVSDLRNQLELAQLQANRRASLYEKGAISREELDERQFGANAIADRLQQAKSQLEELLNGTRQEQLAAQLAQLDQIDARIEALDISLDKSVLYAPFSGTVADRGIDEGTVVGNGQEVLRLVEAGQLEARIGVPERLAQQLEIGSWQSVKVGNSSYSAVVTARLPEIDEASQTVTIVLELEDPYASDALFMGATARLQVNESQSQQGYWLPSTALVASDRGLWSLYVLSESQERSGVFEVARRDVEVLFSEGDRAFVRGLVQPGDIAITNGTHRIVPGQLVKPDQRPAQGRNAE